MRELLFKFQFPILSNSRRIHYHILNHRHHHYVPTLSFIITIILIIILFIIIIIVIIIITDTMIIVETWGSTGAKLTQPALQLHWTFDTTLAKHQWWSWRWGLQLWLWWQLRVRLSWRSWWIIIQHEIIRQNLNMDLFSDLLDTKRNIEWSFFIFRVIKSFEGKCLWYSHCT